MKIMIGYDGSACADRALDDLKRAGLPDEAEALVISVAELRLPLPPPSSYEILEAGFVEGADIGFDSIASSRAVEGAYALALQASRLVQASFSGWTVGFEGYSGSPAGQIIE